MTQRRWVIVLTAFIGAMMGSRLLRWPLEAYGDAAAQYIEHLTRLRMLERIREGLPSGPLEALKALEGIYPPGLHLVELAWGALFGHAAESVLWLGFVWWLLLCGSVAKLATHLIPEREGLAGKAFLATALIPALQATALRSYYDLPMTAVLWLAMAVVTSGLPWRGVWAGLCLVAATLIKWTALPFGGVMLLALVVVQGRAIARPVLSALSLMIAWSAVFIMAGAESFSSMGSATFQPAPGVAVGTAEGPAQWLTVAQANLSQWDAERLMFYPWRLVSTVLSPVGALVLGWATYRGWRSGRVGLRLFALIALGHLAFLLLLVPIQDDRFILTLAPAAAIVAATSLHGRALRGALVAMLLVSADAHLWTPAKESGEGNPWPATRDGQTWTPRLGMSSSVDRRGWSRSTDMRDNKTTARAQLWSAVTACGGGVVDARKQLLSPAGDLNWWAYRRSLAAVRDEGVLAMWRGESGAGERPPQVWVGSSSAGPGPISKPPRGWHTRTFGPWRVATPEPCRDEPRD